MTKQKKRENPRHNRNHFKRIIWLDSPLGRCAKNLISIARQQLPQCKTREESEIIIKEMEKGTLENVYKLFGEHLTQYTLKAGTPPQKKKR